jgi:hypothetical protein
MPREQHRYVQLKQQRTHILQSFVDASQLNHASAATHQGGSAYGANSGALFGSGSGGGGGGGGVGSEADSHASVSSHTCVDRSKQVAVLDVVPLLLSILQPSIRPVGPTPCTPLGFRPNSFFFFFFVVVVVVTHSPLFTHTHAHAHARWVGR